ncbi:MAG: gliding motility-associated C-terminal domain-containing protein [Saprospiraceae bacterium]
MRSIFLFLLSAIPTAFTFAQIPKACAGNAGPAIGCDVACIFCNFDGYVGSTIGYPSGVAVDFCGTYENGQWIGFIAGDTFATFTAKPINCLFGDGVQIALYGDCTKPPLDCEKGEMGGANKPVSVSASLYPGSSYFLLVDGYAGDLCEFSIEVTPNNAVYEPALEDAGDISGPDEVCSGSVLEYYVQPVFGAGAYIWDGPPGTLVNGDSVPVAVAAPAGNLVVVTWGSQGGNLCVQAANACEVNAPCTAALPVTMLPESARPVLDIDTTRSLSCTGQPIELAVQATPTAPYVYVWTADSTQTIISAGTTTPEVSEVGRYALVVTNIENGCISTDTVRVGPQELPDEPELDLVPVSCFGRNDGAIYILGVENGNGPYRFALDSSAYAFREGFAYLFAGDYQLRILAGDGCLWDTMISIPEPGELLVDLTADTTIHLGETLELWRKEYVNDPLRLVKANVFPPELQPMLCEGCPYQPTRTFKYLVTVRDSNDCPASDERMVVVENGRQLFFPNVFRPDSGYPNDLFAVYGGADVEEILLFQVFDRWGQVIHEVQGLAPNDESAGWDGEIKGDPALPGVYMYYAQVRFIDGQVEQFTGDVTVVR